MAKIEKAVFAAGCFWGVEATFQKMAGVIATRVGYTGGRTASPDYAAVCRGDTGHAEAVEVEFDADKIAYTDLLATFWQLHDPTQLNRQGPDIGSQYRSAIFYHSDEQKAAAEAAKAAEQKQRAQPIATEITAADTFWQAEDYHQCYVQKRHARFGF